MTTLPKQQTIVQYVANSSQLTYTFAFYAPLPIDINVYYQSSTATPVPSSDILALNTDYTVTYNSDPLTGGFITLLFTPVSGYYLTIDRNVQASLTTNFAEAQTFNGENLDDALDRLLLLIQQNLNYIQQRNLSYVINTYLPDAQPFTQLPPLPQNYIWIGSASGVVAAQIASSPSASVLQSMLANNSVGTDGSRLVGYYDAIHSSSTTVHDYLAGLLNQPTINQPNIVGVIDGSSAPAGDVGEILSSVVLGSSPVAFTSGVPANVTSLLLTKGQWLVWGNVSFEITGGGADSCAGWISSVSSTQPDGSLIAALVLGTFNEVVWCSPVPQQPFNVSSNTTVYLSGNCIVNAGTIAASGRLYALRVR